VAEDSSDFLKLLRQNKLVETKAKLPLKISGMIIVPAAAA